MPREGYDSYLIKAFFIDVHLTKLCCQFVKVLFVCPIFNIGGYFKNGFIACYGCTALLIVIVRFVYW